MIKKEIQLSNEFRTQAIKAIFAICLFFITYLIILLLAFILTGLCIAGGISIIAIKPMIITLILGIGLASLGILILIFLMKFIFSSHKLDRSHLLEINESQEPKLFELINEIVVEVATSFPKKVYISSEVNASVFYDSSFWSMFLPTKKNLHIGLGLVNTVTKEELKSILAHEFGHFSQRTMKVGSYVFNVNQVIFNMLYDNESYESLIQRWGNVSGYFSIFIAVAVKINEGIQWILRKLYEVVNKTYMGLSREMEFHADEIAASVTGFEPLKNSLLRMAIAENSFTNVINYYNGKISENIKSESLFSDQLSVIHFLAEVNNLTLKNNLPDISLEEQSKYDKSKLVIKDQWASHPTINDRITRLEKTGFSSKNTLDTPANGLFTDIIALQKHLTNQLFEGVSYQTDPKIISSDKFIEQYKQDALLNSFAKMYNGYYDNKNPTYFEINKINSLNVGIDCREYYCDEKVDLVYTSLALQNDIETLKQIAKNTSSIKTFDYDGIKYKRDNADELREKLTHELENINEKIKINDANIYSYFAKIESEENKPKELEQIYNDFFQFDKNFDSKYEIYISLLNELQFTSVTTPFEQIKTNFERIESTEDSLKKEIDLLLSDNIFTTEITQDIKNNLEQYNSKKWEYFGGTSYFDENLNIFYSALHNYSYLLSRKYFLMKKALLTYQESLIKTRI
jgi:Zn-dependent protease with chaperone function